MADKKVIANKIIDKVEDLIRNGVDEDGDVSEGWLEDWDDVEYRLNKDGRYRGVALLEANYRGSGFDVEIDTTRCEVIIRDTDTEEAVLARFICDEETQTALELISMAWGDEFENLCI